MLPSSRPLAASRGHVRLRRAAGHLEFFLSPGRLASRGDGRPGASAGPCGDRGHRSQQLRRDRAGAWPGQGDGTALRRRLPARPRGCATTPLLAHRPAGLCPSQLAPDAGQAAHHQGIVLARPRRHPGPRRGPGFCDRPAGRAGRGFFTPPGRARRSLAAPALSRPQPSLRRQRRGAPGAAGGAGPEHPGPAPRHQRRALSRAGAAGGAGRRDLHPRALHDRRGGRAAPRQRRAPPQARGRDGAAFSSVSRGAREHAGDRRALPFLARRAGLRLSGAGLL